MLGGTAAGVATVVDATDAFGTVTTTTSGAGTAGLAGLVDGVGGGTGSGASRSPVVDSMPTGRSTSTTRTSAGAVSTERWSAGSMRPTVTRATAPAVSASGASRARRDAGCVVPVVVIMGGAPYGTGSCR
ncbi:MAG: hypothetical protein ACO35E_10845 [Ilumatobacteraceae bacterium]